MRYIFTALIFAIIYSNPNSYGDEEEVIDLSPFTVAAVSGIDASSMMQQIQYAIEEYESDESLEPDETLNEIRREYYGFIIDWLQHNRASLKQNKRIISSHNWVSIAIAVLVHALLIFGFYAGWREFNESNRMRKDARAMDLQEEIKISLDGVALKTSFLGMLILFTSIGLYFAFLKYVFPITEIGS